MRIIAGTKRGVPLLGPADTTIRPTADKVRGAVFNILAHASWAPPLFHESIAALDLFCGTGAFAFEALSRGCGKAFLIDNDAASLHIAKRNATALGFAAQCQFMRQDAGDLPEAPHPFQLVFLDPPYRKNLILPALKTLAGRGWIEKGAILAAESAKKENIELPPGFALLDQRSYGITTVTFMIYQK